MSKYLTKLITSPGYSGTLNSRYSITNFSCGDGYKNGTKHRFESSNSEEVLILIDIIKRFKFGTIITEVKANSFEFENKNERLQIFCFRLCRFVRSPFIKKILTNTIIINKLGVVIQNAFLLANYYSFTKDSIECNISYYDNSRDIIYHNQNNLHKPHKTLKSFIKIVENKQIYFSSIFTLSTGNMFAQKKILFEFLKKNKFKKAERYLLKVYK